VIDPIKPALTLKWTRFFISLSVVGSAWHLTWVEKLDSSVFTTLVVAVLALYTQSRSMDKAQDNGHKPT